MSDHSSSDNEEDGEDEDDDEKDTEVGKLSEDYKPCCVMGMISKTVQHCVESVQQKEMCLDHLMQPGWGDTADYFRERDMKYGTTQLKVPAVVKPQTDTAAATPSPTTFEELMQGLDINPRQSQILQVTSRQGSSQMRLRSENPQVANHILSLMPDAVPDSSQIVIAKPVQPVRFYPLI